MKKILYLAVVSAGLILSSCSMSKDAAYLHSQKLQAKQELVNQTQKQDLASVNTPAQNTVAQSTPAVTEPKAESIFKPTFGQSLKALAQTKFAKKAKQTLAQVTNLPKVAAHATDNVNNLLKQRTYAAHADHTSANWLLLWILCLVAGIIFYIIAAAIALTATDAASLGLATVFAILYVLCYIAAVVFFIIWLVHKMRDR